MGGNLGPATVLLSGGIDSVACAHLLRAKGFAVDGLHIAHGQAASVSEQRAVGALCRHLDIPLETLHFDGLGPFSSGEVLGRNAFFVM
jgi:7-cyano-7-deazaguanine synthase